MDIIEQHSRDSPRQALPLHPGHRDLQNLDGQKPILDASVVCRELGKGLQGGPSSKLDGAGIVLEEEDHEDVEEASLGQEVMLFELAGEVDDHGDEEGPDEYCLLRCADGETLWRIEDITESGQHHGGQAVDWRGPRKSAG